ncbi:MAG: hypothetical protein J6D87_06985 [Clostridia bacterium]|nr:hypothetical protein [Clostridia bacterium]
MTIPSSVSDPPSAAWVRPPALTRFRKAGVDITLTAPPCWCHSAETMDKEGADDSACANLGSLFKK